jgi:NAD(P)-dependent dehydrogenase (short-subunit alcohol dehydrogenase family)
MSRSVQQLFNLAGKTALVTGGSRGLGLNMGNNAFTRRHVTCYVTAVDSFCYVSTTAHALGEAGARVIVSSRKEKDLIAAVESLQANGITASHIAADCGDESSIQMLADRAIAETGAVDILVNNAGAAWVSLVKITLLRLLHHSCNMC